jgi:tRNA threonylcarbamoyl adenosine modification protein YeaZ
MKYILLIDTTTKNLNVGLAQGREMVEVFSKEFFQKQSEYLGKVIENLFLKHNISAQRLEKIVVAIGPGSYTGIRIGLTMAKTLSYLLSIPCYPLSTLKALAGITKNALVIISARRDRYYVGLYNSTLDILGPQQILEKQQLLDIIEQYPELNILDTSETFRKKGSFNNIIANMLGLSMIAPPIENIHLLSGEYL